MFHSHLGDPIRLPSRAPILKYSSFSSSEGDSNTIEFTLVFYLMHTDILFGGSLNGNFLCQVNGQLVSGLDLMD